MDGRIIQVFEHWIRAGIVKHRRIDPAIEMSILNQLKQGWTVEEMKEAIDNYALVLHSNDYKWTYKWPLDLFFSRTYDRKQDYKWIQFTEDRFSETESKFIKPEVASARCSRRAINLGIESKQDKRRRESSKFVGELTGDDIKGVWNARPEIRFLIEEFHGTEAIHGKGTE